MNDLFLVYKNLTRKKMRLFLTCFAIFIAFLIFGAISALKSAQDSGVEMSADNRLIVINKISFTQPLPYAYVNKIQSIRGVKDVTHANWFGGYYQEPSKQLVTFAVDGETYFKVYNELKIPPRQYKQWMNDQTGLLIGERIATKYGWKPGDKIPLSSNIFSHKDGGHTWTFTVDGIFTPENKQTDTTYVIFHYKYFKETQTFGGTSVGWLILTTDDPKLNARVAKAIDETFANSSAETKTSTEKAFNKAFIEQIGNIGLIIYGVVFMAFFTILIVVGNTMVLAVRERTGEIAVLKTLGFTSLRIFKMILAESFLLSFTGGILGMLGAFIIVQIASRNLAGFLPNMIIGTGTWLQAIGYMLILGFITGILPAINALRLNVVNAFNRN